MSQPDAPKAHGDQTAFMIERDKLVRIDVRTPAAAAPGGGKLGMTKAEIAALYPARIEEQPHEYSDDQTLRVRDSAGGAGVLIFQTDSRLDKATVTGWRVGVPPQADYVEGCC